MKIGEEEEDDEEESIAESRMMSFGLVIVGIRTRRSGLITKTLSMAIPMEKERVYEKGGLRSGSGC